MLLLVIWQAGPGTASQANLPHMQKRHRPSRRERRLPHRQPRVPRRQPLVSNPATDFRARVAGAIDAKIDWPNSGTKCQGESKSAPPGVRMSFQRSAGAKPDLLFVFGLTGVREGQPVREAGANLTLIVQGTPKFSALSATRAAPWIP